MAQVSKPSSVRPSASTRQEIRIERTEGESTLIFGRRSLVFIGVGLLLMVLGMLLMAGGSMPDPNTWDDSLIYSFRRITLAPLVILAGLGVITYAILKK